MTFPVGPTVGDKHTEGNRSWVWSGDAWLIAALPEQVVAYAGAEPVADPPDVTKPTMAVNGDGLHTHTWDAVAGEWEPVPCRTSYHQVLDDIPFPWVVTIDGVATVVADDAEMTALVGSISPTSTWDAGTRTMAGCVVGTIGPIVSTVGAMIELASNAGGLTLDLVTGDGSDLNVEWPDGSTQTVASGARVTKAGQPAGTTKIQSAPLTEADLSGPWSFALAALTDQPLTRLNIANGNAVNGDIATLSQALTYLNITGNNAVNGDVATLSQALTYLNIAGNNAVNGDVATLSQALTYLNIAGDNTMHGDVATLSQALTYLRITGDNTTHGDIAQLSQALTYLNIAGNNTMYGDIATLSQALTVLHIAGNNTTHGDIATLSQALTYLHIEGGNTTHGDIATLSQALTYLHIAGDSTIADYTPASIWGSLTHALRIIPATPGGLDATEVDQLLIDVAAAGTTPTNEQEIILTGANAARTAASDAAVATLQTAGWTVTTN